MAEKKRVIITLEKSERYGDIFQDDIMADLTAQAEVLHNGLARAFTTEELAQRVPDVDAIVTCWGTPKGLSERLVHSRC